MVESVDHRQMPDPDIQDVSAYLASLEIASKLPPVDETAPGFNAYERLLASKRLVQIPRAEGDTEAGKNSIAANVPLVTVTRVRVIPRCGALPRGPIHPLSVAPDRQIYRQGAHPRPLGTRCRGIARGL